MYNTKYYYKNRRKIINQQKLYKQKNKQKIKERDRLYYIKNKDIIKKRSNLRYKYKKDDIIKKGKLWLSKRLKKDPDYHNRIMRKYQSKSRIRNRAIIYQIKINGYCVICNLKNWLCLDFHHIDKSTKKACVCTLATQGSSEKLLLAEIAKCQLICKNCHRKSHTNINSKTTMTKTEYVRNIKKSSCCSVCKESDWRCLEFHHIQPKYKKECISLMTHNKNYSLNDIKKEIKKCIVLCSNCHAIKHANQKSILSTI